jgi:hypothetical protein
MMLAACMPAHEQGRGRLVGPDALYRDRCAFACEAHVYDAKLMVIAVIVVDGTELAVWFTPAPELSNRAVGDKGPLAP